VDAGLFVVTIVAIAAVACAYASAPGAVVPATWTTSPTRTAREYPTIDSHFAPPEIFSTTMPDCCAIASSGLLV